MAKHDDDAPTVLRVQVPARIEADLLATVRAEARQNRRTLGAEMTVLIEEALARRRAGEPPVQPSRRRSRAA